MLFKNKLVSDLKTPKALPMGSKEFDEWSDRIIVQAEIMGVDGDSQRAALAAMLMQLPPTEDFKEDLFFIKSIRKAAVNQVAQAKHKEIYDRRKAKDAAPDVLEKA